MKKFVKDLLTNRFGIVLATLNLCYFVSNGFTKVFYKLSNFDEIILILHFPAGFLTAVLLKFIEFLCSVTNIFSYRQFFSIVFSFFVILQWLFIGWLAKKIAQKIQK